MTLEGNPFSWDFNEQRSIKTLATQASATYNKTQEVKEQKNGLDNFFEQNFGHSPNVAHITGATELDVLPYNVNAKKENK